jgi:hypothetical protein
MMKIVDQMQVSQVALDLVRATPQMMGRMIQVVQAAVVVSPVQKENRFKEKTTALVEIPQYIPNHTGKVVLFEVKCLILQILLVVTQVNHHQFGT